MTRLAIHLIIWSVLILTTVTFAGVIFRRLYTNRKYSVLDAQRARYFHLHEILGSGEELYDIDLYRNKPNTAAWKAVEECLFKSLESPASKKEQVLGYFERLGYTDFYIKTLTRGNRWEKALAADKLGRIRCYRAVYYLIAALFSKYRDIRNMAVYSLGLIKDESSIQSLVEELEQCASTDEEVSARIVKSSLIGFGDSVVPTLIKEASNQDWRVRAAIIDILCEIKPPMALNTFMDALSDPEQEIRAKAAKGLGRLGDRAALPYLIGLLRDESWVVRLHATRALGLIKDLSTIGLAAARLEDKNWQVRKVAAEAMGNFGLKGNIILLKAVLYGTDRYAREQSIDELENLGVLKAILDSIIQAKRASIQKTSRILDINHICSLLRKKCPSVTPEDMAEMVQLLSRAGRQQLKELTEFAGQPNYDMTEMEQALSDLGMTQPG